MRQLLPEARADLTDTQLDELYGWPESPWLRANMVSTIDGAAASPDGLSEGISSPADRRIFGRLRGLADVVLVGAGTARSEGYRPARVKQDFADRRAVNGQNVVPAIAVVSRSAQLDLSMPLYANPLVPTIVITSHSADSSLVDAARATCEVIVCGQSDVDLPMAITALHERGLTRIHSEGGPRLLADLVAADLLDELLLTLSPAIAGGSFGGDGEILRILQGSPNPHGLRATTLHHLIEEDSNLFASYHLRHLQE
jgi:riboflavin biosynthesis pyrimidine reductase